MPVLVNTTVIPASHNDDTASKEVARSESANICASMLYCCVCELAFVSICGNCIVPAVVDVIVLLLGKPMVRFLFILFTTRCESDALIRVSVAAQSAYIIDDALALTDAIDDDGGTKEKLVM